MLQLKNIVKDYSAGDSVVHALKGVSIDFRKSEFVAILGQSGCGKTTLLNIIGGLDRYTSGDLIINAKTTKKFKDADWDTYRNHSVGFVFQSYNLIPHQSVLANVELALTLTGVSKAERKRRAKEALEKVGLGDQIHKKPNQMSGGQMQRVAIARAIVNDPDILLADEPTGALDTATSVQIMDILKSISKEKLIIMVTHNPELADQYASRIIKLSDGEVIDDSAPYDATADQQAMIDARESAMAKLSDKERKIAIKEEKKKQKKPSMSFFTALSLSLNNLMTKKTRTILTSFAGSIGIIGIALILALSTGIQAYIDDVQEETLASYPITINSSETDLGRLLTSLSENSEKNKHDKDAVYSNTMMYQFMNAMTEETSENNMVAFKEFLDKEMDKDTSTTDLYKYAKAISYSYNVPINAYTKDSNGEYIKADMMALFTKMASVMMQGADSEASSGAATSMSSLMNNNTSSGMNLWSEIFPGPKGELVSPMIQEQYDLLYGSWPKSENEVVVILTKDNEISDFALYSLGLKDVSDMMDVMQKVQKGEKVDDTVERWSYEEICDIDFKLVTNADYYSYSEKSNVWKDMSTSKEYMNILLNNNSLDLDIVGVIRPTEDANFAIMTGALGYTTALTEYIIEKTNSSAVVKAQQSDKNIDIFTGIPFDLSKGLSDEERIAVVKTYCASLGEAEKIALYTSFFPDDDEELKKKIDAEVEKYTTRDQKIEAIINVYTMLSEAPAETMKNLFSNASDEEIEERLREVLKPIVIGASAEAFDAYIAGAGDEILLKLFDEYVAENKSESSCEQNLTILGVADMKDPFTINIYASTFETKDKIAEIIAKYNKSVGEKDEIKYTDYVAMLMSSISTVINAISYVLIAFVSISLIVSSIMIGIITYISVLERTKEIGVLRSVGASKKDVSRIFNAETVIEGFVSGAMGILITVLICIPANIIIQKITGIPELSAQLPVGAAIFLIVVSIVLSVVAGLFPARVAAKKDPVEALRSE